MSIVHFNGVSEGVRTLDNLSHSQALYQLSYTHQKNFAILNKRSLIVNKKNGAPGGIRTPGLRIRSPLLYPAELLAHSVVNAERQPSRPGQAEFLACVSKICKQKTHTFFSSNLFRNLVL
jgi:hypothetical protein